ncbi:MAG: GNAT family N-acetyltransferase [Deltaproteobacteria bacterium]
MRVERVESIVEFEALAEAWSDLADRSDTAHLFNTHAWLSAWWEAFGRGTPRVYAVYDDRLVAALPLRLDDRGLTAWFNHYLGRSDVLVDRDRPDAYPALFAALGDDRADWDHVELTQVPEDSPTIAALARGDADPLRIHAVRNICSPYLLCRGTYDAWYKSRFSGRKRQQDRRKLRQAEKRGATELVWHTDVEAVQAAFERGAIAEDKSWKGEEASAMLKSPDALAFMRDVIVRFAKLGAVRLVEQTVGGETAAFLLGFVHGDTFYFHKTGYDPEFADVSPGRTVLLAAIERCFEEGLARFDFLGADDPYKLECSPLVRPHVIAFVYHRGLRSRMLREQKRLVPKVRALRGEPIAFPVRLDR